MLQTFNSSRTFQELLLIKFLVALIETIYKKNYIEPRKVFKDSIRSNLRSFKK